MQQAEPAPEYAHETPLNSPIIHHVLFSNGFVKINDHYFEIKDFTARFYKKKWHVRKRINSLSYGEYFCPFTDIETVGDLRKYLKENE